MINNNIHCLTHTHKCTWILREREKQREESRNQGKRVEKSYTCAVWIMVRSFIIELPAPILARRPIAKLQRILM